MDSVIEKILSHRPPLAGKPSWLIDRINKSVQSCQDMALPNRKNESWKYTNPKKYFDHDYQFTLFDGVSVDQDFIKEHSSDEDINVVFYNGSLVTQLSTLPKGIEIKTIEASLDKLEDLTDSNVSYENVFEAVNDAMIGQGVVVDIENGVQLDQVVHFLFLYDHLESTSIMLAPKIYLRSGKSSLVAVRESHIARSGVFFVNSAANLEVGQNSQISYYKMIKMNNESILIDHSSVRQCRDSRFESFNMSLQGRLIRNDLKIKLVEEGAHVQLDGIYLTQGEQHVDNQTVVDHSSPRCSSSQLYKGVLRDNSRAVFNGKVLIRRDSQQTSADQLNNNLLLSRFVEVDTKPQMEIDADDVKCSHGATVGQMDEEELFYLQSRGIPEDVSRKMLAMGFINEAIQRITSPSVRSVFGRVLEKDAF